MVKLEWLAAAAGLAVVIALAVQVVVAKPGGFVLRTSLTVSGVVVVFALATLILWLTGTLG